MRLGNVNVNHITEEGGLHVGISRYYAHILSD